MERSCVERRLCALVSTLTALSSFGCSSDRDANEGVGVAQLQLQIPNDTQCVRITAESSTKTVVTDVDVAPGTNIQIPLNGLALGANVFSGEAFATSCASVTTSTLPVWITDPPVTATVSLSIPVLVNLTFVRNGVAIVDGFFEEDISNAGPQVFQTLALSPSVNPGQLAFDSSVALLYVVDEAAGEVLKYDRDLNAVGSFALGASVNDISGLEIDAANDRLFVARITGGVQVVTLSSGAPVCDISAGGPGVHITFNPSSGKLYVGVDSTGSVGVYSGSGCPSLATTVTGVGDVVGLAADEIANRVYATSHHANSVSVIDGAADTLLETIPVIAGNPLNIAADPFQHRVFVSYNLGNAITMLDTGPAGIGPYTQTPLTVGDNPELVFTDPGIDRAYISIVGFQNLGVITSGAVAAPLPAGMLPGFVAVDPTTHCLFLASRPGVPPGTIKKLCEPARKALAVQTIDNAIDDCVSLVAHQNALHDGVDAILAAPDAAARVTELAAFTSYAGANAPASCEPILVQLATQLVGLLDIGAGT